MIDLVDLADRPQPTDPAPAAWWLAVPGLDGGRRWYDLMGLYHGTLVGHTSATGWKPTARPGGRGEVRTDGTAAHVDCGTIPGLDGAAKATTAAWVYKPDNSASAGLGGAAGDSISGGNRFGFIWFTDGVCYFSAEAIGITFGFCAIAVGWRRIMQVFDGSGATNDDRLVVYVDGVATAMNFVGTIPAALGNVCPFMVGQDSSNRYAAGSYDDVAVWPGRAFTPAEARADYLLSRSGYSGVLRRWPSREAAALAASAGPGGPTFLPAWAAHANTFLTGSY